MPVLFSMYFLFENKSHTVFLYTPLAVPAFAGGFSAAFIVGKNVKDIKKILRIYKLLQLNYIFKNAILS